MSTIKPIAAAVLGAAALAAPVPAVAAGANELRSAPQIHVAEGEQAKLTFTTDRRLERSAAGTYRIRIEFIHGRRVSRATYLGRHGDDFRYAVGVAHGDELKVGRRYNVRFTFPGQKPVTRLVAVHGDRD